MFQQLSHEFVSLDFLMKVVEYGGEDTVVDGHFTKAEWDGSTRLIMCTA